MAVSHYEALLIECSVSYITGDVTEKAFKVYNYSDISMNQQKAFKVYNYSDISMNQHEPTHFRMQR